jgi:hypothetical protein
MGSVPPRDVTGGWRARTQEATRSSAARADEDEARRRQGRLEWDGAHGGEHGLISDMDAWPDGRVRASRRGGLALDAPLNTYPVARSVSGAYSVESGPPATRRRQASNSTGTCCRGAPGATLLLPRGEAMPCLSWLVNARNRGVRGSGPPGFRRGLDATGRAFCCSGRRGWGDHTTIAGSIDKPCRMDHRMWWSVRISSSYRSRVTCYPPCGSWLGRTTCITAHRASDRRGLPTYS